MRAETAGKETLGTLTGGTGGSSMSTLVRRRLRNYTIDKTFRDDKGQAQVDIWYVGRLIPTLGTVCSVVTFDVKSFCMADENTDRV